MIKKLNELNDIYKQYNDENNKLYFEKENRRVKIKEEAQKELDDKLKELDDDIYSRELEIKKMYSSVLAERKQLLKDIHSNSSFEISVIGPILARLISQFEGKDFAFEHGLIPVKFIEFYEQYKSLKSGYIYYCILITNRSLAELKRMDIELFPSESLKKKIAKDDLLLYSGASKENYISFYDENGEYVLDKKYPYVRDFIDTLIVSRMDNPSKFDPSAELDTFIKENKPKVKKFN